jgi:hypothetical protein
VVIVFLPLRNAVIDVDGFQLDSLRLCGRSEMPLFDTTTAIQILSWTVGATVKKCK